MANKLSKERYRRWIESNLDGIQERMIDRAVFGQEPEQPTPRQIEERKESERRLAMIDIKEYETLQPTSDDLDNADERRRKRGSKALTQEQADEYRYLITEGHSLIYISDHLGVPMSRLSAYHSRHIIEKRLQATRQMIGDGNGE